MTNEFRLATAIFYVSASILLILVAVIYFIRSVLVDNELRFGDCRLDTEVAMTDTERATGLANRPVIASDFAMLFPFNDEKPLFWMKGMLVPIDIVWVDGREVVKIDASLPADDGAAHYYPPQSIDWVVEVAAGRAAECGVKIGSKLYGLSY